MFRHAGELTAILDAARTHKARRLAITGYRGSVLLSNGTTLTEQASLARRRAEQVAALLRGAGLTDVDYRVAWHDEAGAADGGRCRAAARHRRAREIAVLGLLRVGRERGVISRDSPSTHPGSAIGARLQVE